MSDPDRIKEHFDAINRKLDRMPTTRECWAFVLGFAMCAAFVMALTLGNIWMGPTT